jgi:hypothetical protein
VRTILLTALLVAALAGAAGCGGDSGGSAGAQSPEGWSTDMCTAVGDWVDELQTRSDALGETTSGASGVEDVRTAFVDFLDDAVARTDQMVDEVEAAGHPDVENGEEIADGLLAELRPMQAELEDARDNAEALPDDPTAFAQGAQEIGQSMQQVSETASNGIADVGKEFSSAELEEAMDAEPACNDLGS